MCFKAAEGPEVCYSHNLSQMGMMVMVSSHSFVIDPTLTSASQGVLWPQDPLRRLIRMGTNPLKCSVPDEMWGFRSF